MNRTYLPDDHPAHTDRDLCDSCGEPATSHFLSAGFEDELAKLKPFEHHLDLCADCVDPHSRKV